MQDLMTLMASTVCVLDRCNFEILSSSLKPKLQNLRKILDEISKFSLFGQKFSQGSFPSEKNPQNGYSSPIESHFHLMVQSLCSQKTHCLINSAKTVTKIGKNEDDLGNSALEGAYQCLIFRINQNSGWIYKQTLADILRGEQNQHQEKKQEIRQIYDLLCELRNKLKYFMKDHKPQNISHRPKTENGSFAEPQKGDSQSQSSVRSLLTQKLKQLKPITQNDDDFSCHGGKIVVKSSQIMIEMKKQEDTNATEPVYNQGTHSEGSLGRNPQSVGIFSTYQPKISSKSRQIAHRPILKELNFEDSKPRERKAKKQKTGCAQCDIY